MKEQTQGGGGVWMALAVAVAIICIVGGMIYMIGDLSVQRERAVAAQWDARAQVESARAYAQVELARAHEAGSTERMQVFALTLRSFSSDNQVALTLLSVGVLVLGILQLVQVVTRPRGEQ